MIVYTANTSERYDAVSNSIVLWNYMIVITSNAKEHDGLFQTLLFFEIIWLSFTTSHLILDMSFKLYCSLKLYDCELGLVMSDENVDAFQTLLFFEIIWL